MVSNKCKQIKTEPYVQKTSQTKDIVPCVCWWEEEHQQMGSSWGLTDIAMGYLSVELIFVFLSHPYISLFLHACLLVRQTLHLFLTAIIFPSFTLSLSHAFLLSVLPKHWLLLVVLVLHKSLFLPHYIIKKTLKILWMVIQNILNLARTFAVLLFLDLDKENPYRLKM